jgi:hypothetical protein
VIALLPALSQIAGIAIELTPPAGGDRAGNDTDTDVLAHRTPVKSFLRQYSLKGKTVIPFNTNAGYGEGSSFQTVRELCPQSTVLEGFVTRGGVERDGQYLVIQGARAEEAQKEVENWLRKITRRWVLPILRANPGLLPGAKLADGNTIKIQSLS